MPADCILLWTSDDSGTLYLKTDQLDGETDWKIREPIKFTQNIMDRNKLEVFETNCSVTCKEPSNQIYDFNGTFYPDNNNQDEFESLRLKNTLWANTVVASGEAYGLIIYTGKESRIQMGLKKAQTKFGRIDFEINF